MFGNKENMILIFDAQKWRNPYKSPSVPCIDAITVIINMSVKIQIKFELSHTQSVKMPCEKQN